MQLLDYKGLDYYTKKVFERDNKTYLNKKKHIADPTKEDNIFQITENGMYVPSQEIDPIPREDIEALFEDKPIEDLTGFEYYLVNAEDDPTGVAHCWIIGVDYSILGTEITIPKKFKKDNIIYTIGIDAMLGK